MPLGCDSEWSVTIDKSEDVDGLVTYTETLNPNYYYRYFKIKVSD